MSLTKLCGGQGKLVRLPNGVIVEHLLCMPWASPIEDTNRKAQPIQLTTKP